MSETFEVRVPYGIKYTTANPVPVDEIVDSLQALERLLKRTPAFLEKAYDGIKVLETNVYVEKIESGSLYQKFVVEFICNGPENYNQAKELATKIAKESPIVRTTVALGMGALITFGVLQILPTGEPTHNTEAYNSLVLQAGGDINLTATDMQEILDKVSDKKSLARESVAAIRPAKADDNATIEFEDMPQLTIPAAAIAEAPWEYAPPVPEERKVSYDSTLLLIAASDRDKRSTGWAGSIPALTDTRKPITLSESIDPATVHGRIRVKADIIVHERFSKTKKEYQIHSIEIVKVYPSEG